MPDGLRQFADYQPFSALVDTVRGLITGDRSVSSSVTTPSSPFLGASAFALASYLWAIRLYNRRRATDPT